MNWTRKNSEWSFNGILDDVIQIGHGEDYMPVLKGDAQLHRYADGLKEKNDNDKREETLMPLSPQDFRPDIVMLDEDGQSYLLETKLKDGVESELGLLIQALKYAYYFLNPNWTQESWSTYELLNLFNRAYTFSKELGSNYRHNFKRFDDLELSAEHKEFFDLDSSLNPDEFNEVPEIIFVLEEWKPTDLVEAIDSFRDQSPTEFINHSKEKLSKNESSRDRLEELEEGFKRSWDELQETDFSVMELNPSALTSFLETPLKL